MDNIDEDTSSYSSEIGKKGEDVKTYPVSRVVVNPDVFALLRKNSLGDPIKRERWLITRLGQSPSTPEETAMNEVPVYMLKPTTD